MYRLVRTVTCDNPDCANENLKNPHAIGGEDVEMIEGWQEFSVAVKGKLRRMHACPECLAKGFVPTAENLT